MNYYRVVTLGRLEIGFRTDWIHWGLGVHVMWADFLRSAWVTVGPFTLWVEDNA